jgi:hypothetical protein
MWDFLVQRASRAKRQPNMLPLRDVNEQMTQQHEVCLTRLAAQKARHSRRAQVWEETM